MRILASAASTVDQTSVADMALDQGQDPIYCEALCPPEDVYYKGSEDEAYPDPATRQRRYEAAGQSYLAGRVPYLLSARLRGPFDQASGWTNPWRSKRRIENPRVPRPRSAAKPPGAASDAVSPPEQHQTTDRLECLLPSPESLKQAPMTETHPYLEHDKLSNVHNWRNGVQAPSPSRDSFWASTKAQMSASATKRRARESAWLKRVATKRQKTDSSDAGFSNSPLAPKASASGSFTIVKRHSRLASTRASPQKSPGAVVLPSSQKSRSTNGRHCLGEDEQGEQDELMTTAANVSWGSASERPISSAKRVSPRGDVWKLDIQIKGAEDELSQKEAAAATLSSPVSQPAKGRAARASYVEPAELPMLRGPNKHDQARQDTESDEEHDEVMQDADFETAADDTGPGFETQRDQSFCFKMRPKLETGDDDGKVGEPSLHKLDQQLASSPEDSLQPEPPSGNRRPQGDADFCDSGESGSSETSSDLDEREMQPVKQQSDDGHGVQALPSFGPNNPRIQEASGGDVLYGAGKVDEQAPAVPLAQAVAEDPELAAEPETLPPPPSLDVPHEPSHACQEPVPERGSQGVDHTTAQGRVRSASEDENAVSSPTALGQGNHPVQPPESMSDSSSPASEEAGTHGLAKVQGDLEDAAVPAGQDNGPVGEEPATPAARGSSEFSLKNLFNHLIPSSPWARLSQLTARSAPPIVPEPQTQGPMDVEHDEASPAPSNSPQQPEGGTTDCETPSVPAGEIEAVSPNTGLPVDPPTMATEAKQDGAADGVVFQDAADTERKSFHKSPDICISASQQSPWTKTQLSQLTLFPAAQMPGEDIQSQPRIPLEAQSPWSPGVDGPAKVEALSPVAAHETLCDDEDYGRSADVPMSQSRLRPSTPEPQFSVKSFASFMSPSPDRSHRLTGRTRLLTAGRLLSAMKGPWSGSRTDRRVSWATMPHDKDDDVERQSSELTPPAAPGKSRPASPPPPTPIAELPTSGNSKFSKHFAAIASRTGGLRQRLIPTASQQVLQSPGLQGMAETFLAADRKGNHGSEVAGGENDKKADTDEIGKRELQEPVNVVDDMFREMGDFLQAWDVDAELDQARRKAAGSAVPQASQSPW